MRIRLFITLLVVPVVTANAQPNIDQLQQAAIEAMSPFSILQGRWTGTASVSLGPGQMQEATVVETGRFRLGGSIFVVEGLGHDANDDSAEPRVVHHALGVISYNTAEQRFTMRAYRLGGQAVDAAIEIDGNRIGWSFDNPNGGRIEYEITVEPGTSWHETGQYSPDDGASWFPFFEMNLEYDGKVSDG